jgi:two-component system chemotaxis response regulator CheY
MSVFKSGFFMGHTASNGRVLLVDDEPAIRNGLRLSLGDAGYEVLEAENGDEAIKTINEGENPLLLDVLICDMPKVNGLKAIAYFRLNYPRVPIVALTGFPEAAMAVSLFRHGVIDYLMKPVAYEQLRMTLARAMEQRQWAYA